MTTPELNNSTPGSPSPDPELEPSSSSYPPSLDDTIPPDEPLPPVSAPSDSGSGDQAPPSGPQRGMGTWKTLALVSILTLLIIAAMSAYGGYRSGLQLRSNASSTQSAQQIATQYALGIQDLEAKRLDLARQRFEWIIDQDPAYPGAADYLAQAILQANITATATPAPTPTVTPTPDMRSVEELWTQSQQFMAGSDWNAAIESLLKLRKDEPGFHAIEIDGMLYTAFRNRGVEKIQRSDLEGGTYDLTLAERFGPLDSQARNWRDWAEAYITGASFWEVDWLRVIEYFSNLAPAVPNLADGSGWTATQRLQIAYFRYGDQVAAAGDFCLAQQQYEAGFSVAPDESVQPTAQWAADECNKQNAPPPPPPGETPTPTLTPTLGVGGVQPTEGAPTEGSPTEAVPPASEPAPASTEAPGGESATTAPPSPTTVP